MEIKPRFNEHLYVLCRTNDILEPIYCKMYGKEPRYNETLLIIPVFGLLAPSQVKILLPELRFNWSLWKSHFAKANFLFAYIKFHFCFLVSSRERQKAFVNLVGVYFSNMPRPPHWEGEVKFIQQSWMGAQVLRNPFHALVTTR